AHFVNGVGMRRLILFTTHGASRYWLDGTYRDVLSGWLTTSTVALLQLLPRHQWNQTALGDPQGICHGRRPGLATSLLEAEPFWWVPLNKVEVPFVPLIGLDPIDVAQFAHMQMGRGHSVPVVFLDESRAALKEGSEHSDESARATFGSTFDVEGALAALKSD